MNVACIDWENFRREDGSIDLTRAYGSACGFTGYLGDMLVNIEKIQPIKSRQVAAVAISHAYELQEILYRLDRR